MEQKLILVDLFDRQIGTMPKLETHRAGRLHRAFSVFLVHDGRMLLQRRAEGKYHSGGLWANACCSHPRDGQTLEAAAAQRLSEELGIADAAPKELFSFVYRAVFDNGLTEYEYDHVFLTDYDGPLAPDPDEIDRVEWVDLAALETGLLERPAQFAPWFLIAAPRVLRELKKESMQK